MNKNICCSKCVMDTSAKNIIFDEFGVCNFCKEFEEKLKNNSLKKKNLNKLIDDIKKKKGDYNCIIGLSGGVDSCYTLHKAIEIGLKPLVVHMDNGWNSELAQNNIENLIKKLDVDLYTHVINWEEYKNMMEAFFQSDVIDVELLMDNAMLAVNYQQASKNKISYILAGTNTATEGMPMPSNMNWFKYDKKNIEDIVRKFSNQQLDTYPIMGSIDLIKFILFKRIKWISFLDYFDYNKVNAIELLKNKYDFKPYPYKHYESVFTRFYQGYILPNKFNIDKRKLHLSTLIVSGQLTRKDAMIELKKKHAYPSEEMLENDKLYFLKKLNWTQNKLDDYLSRPEKSHLNYKSEKNFYELCLRIYKFF